MSTTYLAAEIRRLALIEAPPLDELLMIAAQVERMERFCDRLVGDARDEENTLAALIRRVS